MNFIPGLQNIHKSTGMDHRTIKHSGKTWVKCTDRSNSKVRLQLALKTMCMKVRTRLRTSAFDSFYGRKLRQKGMISLSEVNEKDLAEKSTYFSR